MMLNIGWCMVTRDVSRKDSYFSPILDYFNAWFDTRSYGEGVRSFFIGFNCAGWIPGMTGPANDFETGYLLRKKYTKARHEIEIEVKLNYAAVMQVTSQEAAVAILRVALQRICQELSSLKTYQFDGPAFQADLLLQLDKASWVDNPLPPVQRAYNADTYKPNASAMALPKFWELISQTGEATSYAPTAQCALLVQRLATHTEKQIIGFEVQLRNLLKRLYHYNVLAIAKLVEGYVSDDSFLYFCCNLILQGPDLYRQVLRQSDAITIELAPQETGELLLGIADEAFELKLGLDTDKLLPREYGQSVYDYNSPEAEMMGKDWETIDLLRRFPRLTLKYPLSST
jgi:hypothetical protein